MGGLAGWVFFLHFAPIYVKFLSSLPSAWVQGTNPGVVPKREQKEEWPHPDIPVDAARDAAGLGLFTGTWGLATEVWGGGLVCPGGSLALPACNPNGC